MRKITPLALILLCSCATTKQVKSFKSPNENTSDGKSTVCVIRPRTFFGSGVATYIFQDNKLIGKLGHANYFCWESDPGSHTLTTEAENKRDLPINFDANQKYFYRLDYSMGVIKARAKLVEISEDEFSRFSLESKRKN